MRELAVFYCPKCGYYAYYQTSRHPQCPRCSHPDVMHMARMHYREFMDMGCKERDDYLALEILKGNPSYIKRITAPHKRFNSREIIAEMNIEIMRLDTENKKITLVNKEDEDTGNGIVVKDLSTLIAEDLTGKDPDGVQDGVVHVDQVPNIQMADLDLLLK